MQHARITCLQLLQKVELFELGGAWVQVEIHDFSIIPHSFELVAGGWWVVGGGFSSNAILKCSANEFSIFRYLGMKIDGGYGGLCVEETQ